MRANGKVYLVGAGPGDAGLFTLRGAELLSRAEVVIYDGLVNRELLRFAPPTAEIIYGGKHDRTRCMSQDELNALLLTKARAGRRVVRLKGGDPYVFGRGGEEAELLAEAGVPFEVVPGVSSVQSVPCYAGIPLTHRHHSSSVAVVTGHEDPSSPANKLDWARLARVPGTLVVLMGLTNIRAITATLVAHGRSADTPVAIISRGTTNRQRTVVGSLATIADLADLAEVRPPAVTVIGEVVKLRERLNWFEQRPLFGRRVVVTQRRDLARPLVALLRQEGAEVLEVPATRWGPHPDRARLDKAVAEVACYAVEPEPADSTGDAAKMVEQGADWIVFASGLAIEHFHARFDLPKLMARFPSTRLAIASDSIKWALAGLGLEPAIIATPENVEGLVDLLARAATMGDAKCPLIHPDSVAHRQLPREEREETGVPEHYLPFSIGSDEVEDVKPYVNQALQVPQK